MAESATLCGSPGRLTPHAGRFAPLKHLCNSCQRSRPGMLRGGQVAQEHLVQWRKYSWFQQILLRRRPGL